MKHRTAKTLLSLAITPLLLGGVVMFASASVNAQELSCPTEERKPVATAMDERTFRRLTIVHELLGNSEYTEALSRLQALAAKGNFTPYEESQIEQAHGFILIGQGGDANYRAATPHFERAIELDALPDQAQKGMMYSLASLYMQRASEPGNDVYYQKTIDMMLRWLCIEKNPKGDALILIASAYAQQEKYKQALPWVQRAIASQPEKPVESWYQLELAIYYEERNFSEAAKVLKKVVAHWPSKARYWEMLSGAYQELRQDDKALATMMLAYQAGLIDKEDRLLNVARMNLFLDNPVVAGNILQTGMNNGTIQESTKNLELMLGAWTAAREFEKAIAVIDKLAPRSDTGDYYFQRAQLFMEKAGWAEVVESANNAIDKGLDEVCEAHLMVGVASAELDRFDAADQALKMASRTSCKKSVRDQARGWQSYVQDRRQAASERVASN